MLLSLDISWGSSRTDDAEEAPRLRSAHGVTYHPADRQEVTPFPPGLAGCNDLFRNNNRFVLYACCIQPPGTSEYE